VVTHDALTRVPVSRRHEPVAALYDSEVVHARTQTIGNVFAHRVYLWLVDLDDLPRLPRWLAPFARFEPRDHCHDGEDPALSIRDNLTGWLDAAGVHLGGGRILMLANARSLGHVFNPISLFWCHRADGALECVVAEVHNTYGGRHRYLLRPDARGAALAPKTFYVSPFLTVDGVYRMRVAPPGEELSVAVTLCQGGRPALTATVTGTRRPVSTAELIRVLLRMPFVTYRTSFLIRRHGIALWLRRLPVVPRPRPVASPPASRAGGLPEGAA
jgi:hypothetical protein